MKKILDKGISIISMQYESKPYVKGHLIPPAGSAQSVY
jgi:hypothetical protein